MLYWIYTYVRNILSLFSILFPGTLTICMALHGNPNFMKKTKLIFEFISILVVLVGTVCILALSFNHFPQFPELRFFEVNYFSTTFCFPSVSAFSEWLKLFLFISFCFIMLSFVLYTDMLFFNFCFSYSLFEFYCLVWYM